MANTSKPCGLRPVSQPYGSIRCNWYKMVTGCAIYMYHPMALNASGYAETATVGSDNALVGSAIGFADNDWAPISDSYSGYCPANPSSVDSSGYVNVLIADDPEQLFIIEEDSAGTALTVAANFAGIDLCYLAASGSTVSGISYCCADASTVGTNTGQQLQLIKKLDRSDNAYGDYCKWIARIHYHKYNPPNQVGVSSLI